MKLKKLLALMVAAFTLIAATSVSFATTTDPAEGTSGTESNPAQTAVGKLLQVPEGTSLDSDQSFTFRFTQLESVDLKDAENNVIPIIGKSSKEVNISDKKLTIKKDSIYQETANGTTTYGAQTKNIFDGVTFPNAGVYAYKVTENKPDGATTNDNGSGTLISTITQDGTNYKVTKQYSGAEYMMYVYVKNKEDGSDTYVAAVGIEMTKGDGIPGTEGTPGTDGTPGTPGDGKVNGTPGTPGTEGVEGTPGSDGDLQVKPGKVNGFRFTNSYSKIKTGDGGGDPDDPIDDPIDPTDDKTHTITLSKTVFGDYGDHTKYFDFNVKLDKGATVADGKKFFAYVLEGNNVVTAEANYTSPKTDGKDKKYIEITPETETTIKLKHSQKLVFTNAEVGTVYTFKESAAENYTPSAAVKVNGVSSAVNGTENTAFLANNASKAGEAENSTVVTNTYVEITPTGLILNNLPYILVILAGIALTLIVRTMRRRVNENA